MDDIKTLIEKIHNYACYGPIDEPSKLCLDAADTIQDLLNEIEWLNTMLSKERITIQIWKDRNEQHE